MKKLLVLGMALLLSACTSTSGNKLDTSSPITLCSTLATSPGANELPDIALPCLTESGITSTTIPLSSVKGPFLFNLWGSWCTACLEEIPFFVEFNKGGTIPILGLDVEEAKAMDGVAFAKKYHLTWPNFIDLKGVTRGNFGMGVPVTWFVDKDGHVTFKKIGQIHSLAELQSLVNEHLEGSS